MLSTPVPCRTVASTSGEAKPSMTTTASIGRVTEPSRVMSGPRGGSSASSFIGSGEAGTFPANTSLRREVTLLATLPSFATVANPSFRLNVIVVTTGPIRTNVTVPYGAGVWGAVVENLVPHLGAAD